MPEYKPPDKFLPVVSGKIKFSQDIMEGDDVIVNWNQATGEIMLVKKAKQNAA